MPHTPFHWIIVALVAAAFLLALSDAHGQQGPGSTGAGAVFEGRPAMAGAQAGQGALAGPPQGGIGVQEWSRRKPARDIVRPKDSSNVAKPKDNSLAGDELSPVKKGARGAGRSLERSRTGVGAIDGRAAEGG
jgi:hypothetical protein